MTRFSPDKKRQSLMFTAVGLLSPLLLALVAGCGDDSPSSSADSGGSTADSGGSISGGAFNSLGGNPGSGGTSSSLGGTPTTAGGAWMGTGGHMPGSGGVTLGTGGGAAGLGAGGLGSGGVLSAGGLGNGGANPGIGGANPLTGGAPSVGGWGTGGIEPGGGGSEPGGGGNEPGSGGKDPGGAGAAQAGAESGGAGGGAAGDGAAGDGAAGDGAAGDGAAGGGNDVVPSSGCNREPTLRNSRAGGGFEQNELNSSGKTRQFLIRWPDDYDNTHPYRLILGLHGATGDDTQVAGDYFGLWSLSEGSTIFVAPSADGGLWSAQSDTTFVQEILETVEADLCIDTSRIMLEGFSQGAAMSWTLACSLPGVFRAVAGHSGGGVTPPSSCEPIAYLGSLGLRESGGQGGQETQTDRFAEWNSCTIETLPEAPSGGHVCTNYDGCPVDKPVVWCSFDGEHTPSPTDNGQSTSWMPSVVWPFFTQF